MLEQNVEAASFYHICPDLVSPWHPVLQEAREPACGPLGSQSSPSGKQDLWSGWQDFWGLKYLQSVQLCWAWAIFHSYVPEDSLATKTLPSNTRPPPPAHLRGLENGSTVFSVVAEVCAPTPRNMCR